MKFKFICENCGIINEVTVYPRVRGTYDSPEEQASFDPQDCAGCGERFNADTVFGHAAEIVEELKAEAAEERFQRVRDGE